MKIPVPSPSTLRKYGLTEEQYVELWSAQGGRCPICTRRFNKSRPANTDHDHRTYRVRGLLDGFCNYEIGCHHDNADWFQNAANYLYLPTANRLWIEPPLVFGAPVRENV